MAPTLPELGPLEETLWLTLCGRAVDNRQPRPILGDTWADDIVRRFDYDDSRFGALTSPSSGLGIALRGKKLDKVVRDFTARHPNAVGLDLGCGLDSRVHRIDPPSTVDWYNIDFPNVIAARERALPERANTHGIAADLTEPGWLDGIPADRPAVAVADGLVAFLTLDELSAILRRLTSHFSTVEVAFNSYTTLTVRITRNYRGTRWLSRLFRSSGFDDPREPEHWAPGLKLVRESVLVREPEVAAYPPAVRVVARLASLRTRWGREAGGSVLHYRSERSEQPQG